MMETQTQIFSPAASQVHKQTMLQNTANTGTGGYAVRKWLCSVLAAALLVAAGCDGSGGTYTNKFVDSRLRGTWESTDTSLYSGSLVIGVDTVTVTGCGEAQTPPEWNGGDDAKRPFRNFAKNAPYPCYTADGTLFIETAGDMPGFPFVYSTSGTERYLRFMFGGRDEALKRTGN
jgi:hypothetical protein